MKRKITFTVILGIFLILCFTTFNNSKKNNELDYVRVSEVAHSIFYAPSYVAINEGFFEEYGIDVDVTLTPGADKVAASILSNDADIGFSGSEICLYVYNGGEKDYLMTFAAVTQKDGSFIVSREKIDNFTLNNLKGKSIIGGRKGGMPEMTFEYTLRRNGIDPKNDVNIDTSIAFAAMGGAFIGGTGDFVTLFEPTALEIEKQGLGYVVGSVGEYGGIVPYTSYSAKKSYIENNKDLINRFNKALQKGLDFVHNKTDLEVAKSISKDFPDTKIEDLEKIIKRYREIDAWPATTFFSEESFNHLQDIMIDAKELDNKVDYNKLIYQVD